MLKDFAHKKSSDFVDGLNKRPYHLFVDQLLIYRNIDRDSYKKVLMESTMKKRDQYGEFLDSLSLLGKILYMDIQQLTGISTSR